jgi:hypothetical protein
VQEAASSATPPATPPSTPRAAAPPAAGVTFEVVLFGCSVHGFFTYVFIFYKLKILQTFLFLRGGSSLPVQGLLLKCLRCCEDFPTKAAINLHHRKTHSHLKGLEAALLSGRPVQRRKRPTLKHKLHVLEQLAALTRKHPDLSNTQLVRSTGYSPSTIRDWEKSPRLVQVAQCPHLRGFKALRTVVTVSLKFQAQYDELYCQFVKKRRLKGEEVDERWIMDAFKSIMQTDKPAGFEKFKYSHGWIHSYLKRYRISHQMQTEKKPVANEIRVPLLQAFHRDLCLLQQSAGLNARDPEFGRFAPQSIWNVDQIPFSFMRSHRHSYNPIGEPCWVKTQGESGNDKRMATIILTLRGQGEQIIKPFILFKGEGCLSKDLLDELNAYDIPYGFNTKAWANGPACLDYLQYFSKHVKLACPEFKEHLLLLDGLGTQCTFEFIQLAMDLNIMPLHFPPNCTHLVQPVDHRVAAWLKNVMAQLFKKEESIMSTEWDRYRENGSLTAQYKRATMLDWVQRSWTELKTRVDFLSRSFTSTGCLITLSGKHSIKFKDIPNYEFTAPL